MKLTSFVLGLFGLVAVGLFAACHGDQAKASNWRVVWFPPNDTMKSWDWVEESGRNWNTMKVFPTDYAQKFPDEVKRWELGVLSTNASGKSVLVPLKNPHSGNTISFEWMPGEFREGMDRLDALGEGTFLCAILGGGKRYSNVAKVTIRHDYDPGREPVIRLIAVQPYGKGDPIKYIGAWIVAPTPTDPQFITITVSRPTWEVDGTWRVAPGIGNGAVYPLPSGVSWGEVYDVGYREGFKHEGPVTMNLGGFEPPILPFTDAKVRLRICDQVHNFSDIVLTDRQREYVQAMDLSRPIPGLESQGPPKTYVSGVFNIQADGEEMDRFDAAFKSGRP